METQIRLIEREDNDIVHSIIISVGQEFGAIGEGFGPSDAEVVKMSEHYNASCRSAYWVALIDGVVVGGAGIAPFTDTCCELRKLFLLPEARGHGLGAELVRTALMKAKEFEFTDCYLDTLSNMTSAIALYQKLGFKHLSTPFEETEHNGCDVWMLKSLD